MTGVKFKKDFTALSQQNGENIVSGNAIDREIVFPEPEK